MATLLINKQFYFCSYLDGLTKNIYGLVKEVLNISRLNLKIPNLEGTLLKDETKTADNELWR